MFTRVLEEMKKSKSKNLSLSKFNYYNMKKLTALLFLCGLFSFSQKTLPTGYEIGNRSKTNINFGWKFQKGELTTKPIASDFDDSNWEVVSVPHTPKLVSYEMDSIRENWIQKKYLRDISWYRKKIQIDKAANEKVFLEFEAVHNATHLWVNGQKVGSYEVNGYVPFHFDITDFVVQGENTLAVMADNTYKQHIAPDPHRTDYVKFGGIYRDVFLVKTNAIRVTFNWEDFDAGVHITTPTVNPHNGTVSVKTTIKNESDTARNTKIVTRILNKDGFVIKKLEQDATIVSNSSHTFRQTTTIEDDYHLWSPDTPYLYRVNSVIYDQNKVVDFVENTFGFRTFSLQDGKGFVLNGKPLFLVGANRHQNYPVIGDAVPNSFHYNEALQYKKAGMNIIRLSHYTQDDAFIEACDELGILVYEEPSTWIEWGDDMWFSNLEKATRTMIRNHRNHPSIIVWGAGINHRGTVPLMQTVAKEEDPFRLTASASSPWSGMKNQGVSDVHATMDYRRTEFPESAFNMLMEHGSSPDAEVNQFHISRYKAHTKNIAAITWLGADYNHLQPDVDDEQWKRDFMTSYAVLSAYRLPKPVYYWYQSELVGTPIVHIADETASKDGKVRVFSNCQKVSLFHNGKLIAKQLPNNSILKQNLDHPSFTFLYNWTAGTLKAVGYNNGQKVAEFVRTKQQTPYKIKLDFNIDNQPFFAGGSDLRLVHAAIVDSNGEVVTDAKNKVTFSVKGAGELVDNGTIDVNPAIAYNGVASIYIRGTETPGKIYITAKSNGLKSANSSITTVMYNTDEIVSNAEPIYDYPITKVDIGGEDQLVQFEWKNWTGSDNAAASFVLSDYDAKVALSASAPLKWLGERSSMVGDLSYVGTDGVYIDNGSLQLEFKGLAAGSYRLESMHHSRKAPKKPTNKITVNIEDAMGYFERISDDHIVDYYDSGNTGERPPLTIHSLLQSDGMNPIKITFKNTNDKDSLWLNGFVLRRVK